LRLINKKALQKLKRKNRGNRLLTRDIDKLISDIENNVWKDQIDLNKTRPDVDCVHNDGFYFFNISIHRTMVLIEFDENETSVAWVGSHKEYDRTFKNNKNTIRNWLKSNDWI